MKKLQACLCIAVGLTVLGFGGRGLYKHLRWKRFAVVHEGRVYRSGQLEEHQFRQALKQLKLKSVICLNPDAVEWEQRLCAEAGVKCYSFPMPSSGLGDPEYFREIVGILSNERSQPVLVHCRAGVARTGASIALMRMAKEGWSYDRAIAELRSFERKGRCEPDLQRHIQEVFQSQFAGEVDNVASRRKADDRL